MDRYKLTKRISILGIAANLALLAAKLLVGYISGSQAMIADGFNSAGDVFASAMTFFGNRMASKPEDENHPYGHGKAEHVFSMIISFSLILVAFNVLRESLVSIIEMKAFRFSWWLVGVASATIIIKTALFLYTRQAGRKEDNLLILANSEDHRNDIFVTSSAIIGIFLGKLGIYWFDGVVGIGISFWIAFTGLRIFKSSFRVLMDTNIDIVLKKDLLDSIHSTAGVDHVDSITAKPVGVRYIIIVKVSVDGDMTVNESHSIAGRIRSSLRGFKKVQDVVVHINPT